MRRCVSLSVFVLSAVLLLWGCSQKPDFVAKYEPWRDDEERACLASGYVRETPFLVTRASLGGPSVCGALRPFQMSAASQGRVSLRPAALLRCSMIPPVERWVQRVVELEARRHFGMPLVELKVAASYGCRPMNNVHGAKLSEHGHANAVDISEFVLANGRRITVRAGWFGDPRERAFLRAVHAGACWEFTTVLGPNYDSNHRDHFHLDLARHGHDGRERICK